MNYSLTKRTVYGTTPKTVDHDLMVYCQTVVAGQRPEYLPVIVDPLARHGHCFESVAERVSRDGGRIVYGWCIWVSPVAYDAEFHAVWEIGGKLIDIVPKPDGETRILFLRDPNRKWEGRKIPNIVQPRRLIRVKRAGAWQKPKARNR